jgi:ribosomal protein S18 acetylase RimI-like enzyme
MELDFKAVTLADIDTLIPLMRAYYKYDGIPFDEAKARKALTEFLPGEAFGKAWLVYQGDEIAGYIVLTYDYGLESGGREAFIDELYLHESYRGQGIGRKTIEFAEQFCAANGIGALLLGVEPENTAAQAFYQKVGFEDRRLRMMTKAILIQSSSKQ